MLFSSNPTPSLPSFILFVFLYIFPLFSSVFSSLSFPLTSFFFGFIFAPLLFAFPLFLPFSYIFPAFLLFLEFNRFVQLLLRLPFSLAICFLFFRFTCILRTLSLLPTCLFTSTYSSSPLFSVTKLDLTQQHNLFSLLFMNTLLPL